LSHSRHVSRSTRIVIAVLAATAAAIGLGVAAAFAQAQGADSPQLASGFYSGELEAAGDKLVIERSSDFFGPWTLALLDGDTITPLPVKRSTREFGLDYDVNGGREQLLYERRTKRGSDLFRYDFATQRESRLGRVSKSQCSEFQVEQDAGALVFARDGGKSCKPGIYTWDGSGSPRRILAATKVTEVELDDDAVLVNASVKSGSARPKSGLWVLPLGGGKPELLYRGTTDELTLAGGQAYWTRAEDNELTTDSAFRTLSLSEGACTETYFEDADITAVAVMGNVPVIGIDKSIQRLDAVAFKPGC
jgi:hypothetical protein